VNWNPFHRRAAAIAMQDQSISASDAGRALGNRARDRAAVAAEAHRLHVRATCRELWRLSDKPEPKYWEN
jgi:hypothetical protein